jgi:Flp pilus assembly protein TadG
MSKSKSRRGAEMIEFTFALLPLLMMIFVLLDAAWGIFVKSTLAYAVRAGVRAGISITGTQAKTANSDLTTMVKKTVQASALGFLAGDTGLAKIQVHYFLPPTAGSSDPAADVSGLATGNAQLNIMQVSVRGFQVSPLVSRIYGLRKGVDSSSASVSAIAADLIEPSRDLPPIGAAP